MLKILAVSTGSPGSFLIVHLRSLGAGTGPTNAWRLFIFTGFPGGFTTFSTFTRLTAQLFMFGEWRGALLHPGSRKAPGRLPVFHDHHFARRCPLAA